MKKVRFQGTEKSSILLLTSHYQTWVGSRIIQNKMSHSVGWNRDFRYRRNSGATMRMRVERPAGLFNALTMTVLLNCFFFIY